MEDGLATWLQFQQPYQKRQYLERHPAWICQETLTLVATRLARRQDGAATLQELQNLVGMLQEAIRQETTERAVERVMTNWYTGFVLDLPIWLAEGELEAQKLRLNLQSHKTARQRVALWSALQARARQEENLAPAIVAEICDRLWDALDDISDEGMSDTQEKGIQVLGEEILLYPAESFPLQHAKVLTHFVATYRERIKGDHAENLERSLSYGLAALHHCTEVTTPFRWALIQHALGITYSDRIAGERSQNIESSIQCFQQALHVLHREIYPIEWAMAQSNLGAAYMERLVGEHAENQEQAIACYEASLEVRTETTNPLDWALTLNNLGIIYTDLARGDGGENLEQAILHYQAALRVLSPQDTAQQWAMTTHNLGTAYIKRILGSRQDNLDRAIVLLEGTLTVYTEEEDAFDWAMVQINLGIAYNHRLAGGVTSNIEKAIDHYHQALRIYDQQAYPVQWAQTQYNLGILLTKRIEGDQAQHREEAITCLEAIFAIYSKTEMPFDWASTHLMLGDAWRERLQGERSANLQMARDHYDAASEIFTLATSPYGHLGGLLNSAEIEAERGQWQQAHDLYQQALGAEEYILSLSSDPYSRDSIFAEDGQAAVRCAFCLTQLGDLSQALLVCEQGRAREAADQHLIRNADPARIRDPLRRTRFLAARKALRDLQASMYQTATTDDAPANLQMVQTQVVQFREARAHFNALLSEIRAQQDPVDFLQDPTSIQSLLDLCGTSPPGHMFVYLLATPWGGVALGLFHQLDSTLRIEALTLPDLSSNVLLELLDQRDASQRILGGFGYAQEGEGLNAFMTDWPGVTIAEKARALMAACASAGIQGGLAQSIQQMIAIPAIEALMTTPINDLADHEMRRIETTLRHAFLETELQRCLPRLFAMSIRPILAWMVDLKISSWTLIPCGELGIFPMLATPLYQETDLESHQMPASTLPSLRSWHPVIADSTKREGIFTLGDPRPTHQALRWGEAEARTIAALDLRSDRCGVQQAATREWFLTALQKAKVVDAACHGRFIADDYLQSAMLLANGERFSLADALHHDTELQGLRLLILSACQTAVMNVRRGRDEIRSLAAGMFQAGIAAVLGALWTVDDRATYLLMVRFMQEWLPQMESEPPAAALARAQRWLRSVTYGELRVWQTTLPGAPAIPEITQSTRLITVRGWDERYATDEAALFVRETSSEEDPTSQPYHDPVFWAAFQIIGW